MQPFIFMLFIGIMLNCLIAKIDTQVEEIE